MKKYIYSLVVALLSFLAISTYLNRQTIQPSKILVEVEASVPFDDIFYVYYLQEGVKNWSDENSSHLRIKGSNTAQKLLFEVPIDKKIEKIRIDIGANKQQGPIQIKSLVLSSEIDRIELKDSINTLFSLNVYTLFSEGLYKTREVEDRYDPFLISKDEVTIILERLRTPGKLFSSFWVYTFTIIFSMAFGISFFFSFKGSFVSVMALGFILIIITPLTVQLLHLNTTGAKLEKRELTKMPELKPLTDFPDKFEDYYSDNFGLRDVLIEISGMIKTNIFKSSPKPELVLFGKDQFLFYNSLTDEIYDSYTHNNLLSKSDLEKYYDRIDKREKELEEKGIAYVAGFWPNKHTIYPEDLPYSMSTQVLPNESLADQITDFFNEKDKLYVDVRNNLVKEKEKQVLYRKLDTHWNSSGAFVGYRAFCEQTRLILGLEPYGLDDFDIKYTKEYSGDLTQQMGVRNIWGFEDIVPNYAFKAKEKNYKEVYNENYPNGSIVTLNENAPQQERLLVFRDSFTSQLIQFLSLHYKEVLYVSETYNSALIEEYKPNVVISCRVERYMLTM